MHTESQGPRRTTVVASVQALYYLVTGIWPVISIRSFMLVTGPKRDLWLVKTTGLLIATIGGVVGLGGIRRNSTETPVLGVASALCLAGVDLYYFSRRVLGVPYLLDALGEILLVAGWLVALHGTRHDRVPMQGPVPFQSADRVQSEPQY